MRNLNIRVCDCGEIVRVNISGEVLEYRSVRIQKEKEGDMMSVAVI